MDKIDLILDDVSDVYDACISRMREDRKNKFLNRKEEAINFSMQYESLARDGIVYRLQRNGDFEEFDGNEFAKIYTQGLVSGSGRIYYDRILNMARDGFCAYCSQHIASTLDHYLPKSNYELLSVTPSNLIPCCKDCNSNKTDNVPSSYEDVCINPYFDDINSINEMVWLKGILKHEYMESVSITFMVDGISDAVLKMRLEKFFSMFKLNYLYSVNATKELNIVVQKHLKEIHELGFNIAKNVILRLLDDEIAFIENKSSWKAATYRALREDSWYLNEYLARKSCEDTCLR